MWNEHPNLSTLTQFIHGGLTAWQRRDVADHLLGGCPVCGEQLAIAGRDPDPADEVGALDALSRWAEGLLADTLVGLAADETSVYETAFDRVFARIGALDRQLRRERGEAPALLAALEPHPVSRRLLMVRNTERFHSVGLCNLLIEEGWKQRFHDPAVTRDHAQVALAVSECLVPERYGLCVVEDLSARVWAYLGNAHRILADLRQAERAFDEAVQRLEAGSGSLVERARLLDFKAALRSDQGRFDEADALLDEAAALYGQEQELHSLGLVLINKGVIRGHLDDLDGSIALLRRGLEMVDHDAEPRAVVLAVHNLAYFLNLFGRSREALAVLVQWRFLYLEVGDRNLLLRLNWLEGLIAMNLDRLDQAEGSLKEAQRGFLEQDIGYDAALISLDLAMVYLQQGRGAEVRNLVQTMLPVFRSHDIHREAAAALIVFCQAVKRDQLTASLVTEVADFLEQARRDPKLRFETDLDL